MLRSARMVAYASVILSISAQDAVSEEIVVVGPRSNYRDWWQPILFNPSYTYYSMPNFGSNYPYSAGSPAPAPSSPTLTDKTIKVIVTDERNRAAVQEAALVYARAIAAVTDRLGKLSDGTLISFTFRQQVYTMPAGELKALWANYEFAVTDRSYGLNRAGRVNSLGNGKYLSEINYASLMIYAQQYANDAGITTIALHELGHKTIVGVNFENQQFTLHFNMCVQSRDPGGAEQIGNIYNMWYANRFGHFGANESFVNNISRAISSAVGLDGIPNPTWGF